MPAEASAHQGTFRVAERTHVRALRAVHAGAGQLPGHGQCDGSDAAACSHGEAAAA
ncbi:MAG TPA: hypothetical protein VKR30_08035 [Candidatus Limnocylindrales bacterium]|nr:hypothetical protein [Candidatus Limnocylindrales bacterium]